MAKYKGTNKRRKKSRKGKKRSRNSVKTQYGKSIRAVKKMIQRIKFGK